jgi:signal transduction histidine kinase
MAVVFGLPPKSRMASHSQSRNRRRLAFIVLSGASIFVADVLLPETFVLGMAYVIWLLISLWSPGRRLTIHMAWVATALIVAGFIVGLSPESSALAAIRNRGVAALGVWVVAVLIVRRKRSEAHQGRIEARRRASLRTLGVEPDAHDDLAAGHIVTAQEEERSRLARELHDDLAPRLALAANEVQALRIDPAGASERALRLERQLAELAKDFQLFSRRLYPTALDRLDLAEAIELECRSVEERSGLWIDFESRNVPRTLPKLAVVCLYRVCQESLSNVAKHSRAEEARVLLEAGDDGLTLTVSDSGIGFDSKTTKGNSGILSMRERARLAGGRFEVRSGRGVGTEIVAFVPVAWTDEGLAHAAHA